MIRNDPANPKKNRAYWEPRFRLLFSEHMVRRYMKDTGRETVSPRSFRFYLLKYEGESTSEIEIRVLCLERLARFGMLEESPRGSGTYRFSEVFH